MADNVKKGRTAEEIAAAYLKRKGYRILERNYQIRGGEIDVVAEVGSFLVFVEVKERKAAAMVSPLESVTMKKRELLLRAAEVYLLRRPTRLQPRFDVVGIVRERDGSYRITHIENAFGGGTWN